MVYTKPVKIYSSPLLSIFISPQNQKCLEVTINLSTHLISLLLRRTPPRNDKLLIIKDKKIDQHVSHNKLFVQTKQNKREMP